MFYVNMMKIFSMHNKFPMHIIMQSSKNFFKFINNSEDLRTVGIYIAEQSRHNTYVKCALKLQRILPTHWLIDQMNNKCYDDLSARFAVFILISYENVPVIDAISFCVIENNVELFHNVCKIDIRFLVQHNKLNTQIPAISNYFTLNLWDFTANKFCKYFIKLHVIHGVFSLGTWNWLYCFVLKLMLANIVIEMMIDMSVMRLHL